MFIFPLPPKALFSLSSLIFICILTHFFLSLSPASSSVLPCAHLHTTPSLPRFSLSLPLFSSSSPVPLLSSAFFIFILSSPPRSFPPFSFSFFLLLSPFLSFLSFFLIASGGGRESEVQSWVEEEEERRRSNARVCHRPGEWVSTLLSIFFMPVAVVSGGVPMSSRGEEG